MNSIINDEDWEEVLGRGLTWLIVYYGRNLVGDVLEVLEPLYATEAISRWKGGSRKHIDR